MAKEKGDGLTDWDKAPVRGAGNIGKGIRIKGIVRGKEDLTVEGEVEGTISLPENHLVLERPSRTSAEVSARNATIRGRHRGNAQAIEKLEISSEAVMIGDIKAPRLVIREGGKFRGTIDMEVPLPEGLLGNEARVPEGLLGEGAEQQISSQNKANRKKRQTSASD